MGNVPILAFGWKINNEKFLKKAEWLSDLKLRLGYGQTGQQEGIGDYNYFASYNTNLVADSYYPLVGTGNIDRPNAYKPTTSLGRLQPPIMQVLTLDSGINACMVASITTIVRLPTSSIRLTCQLVPILRTV